MKILIFSKGFIPQIGGIEMLISMLGSEWMKSGHEVQVITETEGPSVRNGIRTWTQPGILQKIKLIWWADVFFMPNLSFRGFIIWLCAPWKKMVITHQTWYGHWEGKKNLNALIKIFLCRFATNISCSEFLAKQLPYKSIVIPNCYDDHIFQNKTPVQQRKGIGFVGRLVSDKGIDTLLNALLILKSKGIDEPLSIIGDGPELEWIEQFKNDHPELKIQLLGRKNGMELAGCLNQFEVLVVPSKWFEPFGIVALEGLACGCKIVASEKGGLKEAAGPYGFYFENGNAEDCALKIEAAINISNPDILGVGKHLKNFSVGNVAEKYLGVLENYKIVVCI